MKFFIGALALVLAIGLAPAVAQTSGTMDKKAISKACSDQANAKGLHGRERKKFKSECKRAGGKVE